MTDEEFNEKRAKVEKAFDYRFYKPELLKLAMVHGSYFNEHLEDVTDYNERLEFLGDAVLGLCVAHELYEKLPMLREGQLTLLRSQVVSSASCYKFALSLGISDCVFIGKGEQYNIGKGRETIVADFFEAVIGVIYLDGGLQAAHQCLVKLFDIKINEKDPEIAQNWKSQLQDFAQKHFQATPVYQTTDESGPEHEKTFTVSVSVNQEMIGTGKGSSKKEAQFQAAEKGLKTLQQRVQT